MRSALLSVSQRNFQTFRDTLDLTWFQKKLGYEFSWQEGFDARTVCEVQGLSKTKLVFKDDYFLLCYSNWEDAILILATFYWNLELITSPKSLILINSGKYVEIRTAQLNSYEFYTSLKFELWVRTEIEVYCGVQEVGYLSKNYYYIITPRRHDQYYLNKHF